MSIANLIHQILIYSDAVTTDNPALRQVDWTRQIFNIDVKKPTSDVISVPPLSSAVLFDGTRSHGIAVGSLVDLDLISPPESVYRLSSVNSSFRTVIPFTGTDISVVVNNGAMAVFEFVGGSVSSVVVGSIMRVNGLVLYDTTPKFNPENAGFWVVIGVSGNKVSCTRLAGENFSGVSESVADGATDVAFFSSSGVQVGDKIAIRSGFSSVSQRTFVIKAVSHSYVDFVSAYPLPVETDVPYAAGMLDIYTDSKKLIYIELDQESVVRFNGDTSLNNVVSPVISGDQRMVGFLEKWGETYRCEVVNRSTQTMNIKYILGE